MSVVLSFSDVGQRLALCLLPTLSPPPLHAPNAISLTFETYTEKSIAKLHAYVRGLSSYRYTLIEKQSKFRRTLHRRK